MSCWILALKAINNLLRIEKEGRAGERVCVFLNRKASFFVKIAIFDEKFSALEIDFAFFWFHKGYKNI